MDHPVVPAGHPAAESHGAAPPNGGGRRRSSGPRTAALCLRNQPPSRSGPCRGAAAGLVQEGLCGSSRAAAPQAAALLALQCEEEDRHLLSRLGPKDWWPRARQYRGTCTLDHRGSPLKAQSGWRTTIASTKHQRSWMRLQRGSGTADGSEPAEPLECRAPKCRMASMIASAHKLLACVGETGGGGAPMIPSEHEPLACMAE